MAPTATPTSWKVAIQGLSLRQPHVEKPRCGPARFLSRISAPLTGGLGNPHLVSHLGAFVEHADPRRDDDIFDITFHPCSILSDSLRRNHCNPRVSLLPRIHIYSLAVD